MCNPIKTFECIIEDGLTDNPQINITKYIKPEINRKNLQSEGIPYSLLSSEEKKTLSQNGIVNIEYVDEKSKKYLCLRDTDKCIKIIGTKKHKKATTV